MIQSEQTKPEATSLVGKVIRQVTDWAGNIVALDVDKWRRLRLYHDVLRLDAVQNAGVGSISYGLSWDTNLNPTWEYPAYDQGAVAVAAPAPVAGIPVRRQTAPTTRRPVSARALSLSGQGSNRA